DDLACFSCMPTATTAIPTLSLHDALPIWVEPVLREECAVGLSKTQRQRGVVAVLPGRGKIRQPVPIEIARHPLHRIAPTAILNRSEEHTSELQSRENIVCRLLLEKKKKHH